MSLTIFLIPIISSIGYCFNLICLTVLLSPKFKQKYIFKYVTTKVIMEMVSCLLGIGFLNNFNSTSVDQMSEENIFKYIKRSLYLSTGLIEICLTFDRYLILKNIKNWFNSKNSFGLVVSACLLLPLLVFCPYLLTSNSEQNLDEFYSHYFLIINLVINIITICTLVHLSIASAVAFKQFSSKSIIKSKKETTNSYNTILRFSQEFKRRKPKLTFIKMSLTLSFLFVLMRLTDMLLNFICILDSIGENDLIKFFCLIVIYTIQSSNFFVLICFNKKFRNFLKN